MALVYAKLIKNREENFKMENYIINNVVKANNTGELIKYLNKFTGKSKKVKSLPNDVQQVVFNSGNVVVYLTNGNKGVAQLGEHDVYDPYIGFIIAYYKSKNGRNFELKKTLESCVMSATRKGYKQAILKNYDDEKTGYTIGGIVSPEALKLIRY
jgi:hypothetical protein